MASPQDPDASATKLQTRRVENRTGPSMSRAGARVALLGLMINVVLASVKIVAGVVGHAYVLIADGMESAIDVAGSVVIWGGLTVAARPPDRTHPYGHGKAEPLAALVVAICVLSRDWPRDRKRP